MSENKTSKYFKYAIGEIILVVIGILIALQINNWNENRKQQNQLQIYYKQMLKDLDEQKSYINEKITQLDSNIASYNSYKNLFKTKELTPDEVVVALNDVARVSHYLNFRFNTMETLQATGDIKLIPEELRNKIITHKNNLDTWSIVNNGNNEIYLNGLTNFAEKGIGNFSSRLNKHPEIKIALREHVKLIEAILAAESAFALKNFTEVRTSKRLKEMIEEINDMEYDITTALKKH